VQTQAQSASQPHIWHEGWSQGKTAAHVVQGKNAETNSATAKTDARKRDLLIGLSPSTKFWYCCEVTAAVHGGVVNDFIGMCMTSAHP
jgi:hypothetical protein